MTKSKPEKDTYEEDAKRWIAELEATQYHMVATSLHKGEMGLYGPAVKENAQTLAIAGFNKMGIEGTLTALKKVGLEGTVLQAVEESANIGIAASLDLRFPDLSEYIEKSTGVKLEVPEGISALNLREIIEKGKEEITEQEKLFVKYIRTQVSYAAMANSMPEIYKSQALEEAEAFKKDYAKLSEDKSSKGKPKAKKK